MKVSVVVACRNERYTLSACLDALEAQDHHDFEVLFVDGASTDGSTQLLRERGARILLDPGRGPAAARNVGIEAARGDIIAFTDADCVPRFDWLTHLVARFDDPTVAGVAGALRLPRETLLGRMEDNDARLHYSGYITSNVAYRRHVLREVGGFDPALQCAEDYDLAWRILDAGYRVVQEPAAIVLHDPPELADGLSTYLAKQFWYARHDIPAHALAISRAWRAQGPMAGSSSAVRGLGNAVKNAGSAVALVGGLALRSPWLALAGLARAGFGAAHAVARSVGSVGEGAHELLPMASVEAAKRLARGVGTLVGLAELARPGAWRTLTRAAPSAPMSQARLLAPPRAST